MFEVSLSVLKAVAIICSRNYLNSCSCKWFSANEDWT